MREVLPDLLHWWREGASVGVGTVVATWKSAPRQPGASMLVGPEGEAVGSVSGGCVEGAVYELAQEVVASGTPRAPAIRRQRRGRIRRRPDLWRHPRRLGRDRLQGRPSPSSATWPTTSRPADRSRWRRWSSTPTRPGSAGGSSSGRRTTSTTGSDRSAAYGSTTPSPTTPAACWRPATARRSPTAPTASVAARVCGSSSTSTPRTPDARLRCDRLRRGLRPDREASSATTVTVCDARPVFATASRFPDADEVVVDWPHRYLEAEADAGRVDGRTVLCVLTHDPKFDVPLLEVALRLPEVAYIGAMGSRRTHEDRLDRLREIGIDRRRDRPAVQPDRPGPRRAHPEETAVSIAAEIIAGRWGGQGARLTDVEGPIHHADRRDTRDLSTCPTRQVRPRKRRNPCRKPTQRARSDDPPHRKESRMTLINVTVDGVKYQDEVEPRMLLVYYLRERLGKTGTVVGCDTSNCGACTVHLDGRSVKSCNVLAVQADGAGGRRRSRAWPRTASCTRCRRRSTSATRSSAATARRE